jgi:hypothetical protein
VGVGVGVGTGAVVGVEVTRSFAELHDVEV